MRDVETPCFGSLAEGKGDAVFCFGGRGGGGDVGAEEGLHGGVGDVGTEVGRFFFGR
jgi:hypothetical protein